MNRPNPHKILQLSIASVLALDTGKWLVWLALQRAPYATNQRTCGLKARAASGGAHNTRWGVGRPICSWACLDWSFGLAAGSCWSLLVCWGGLGPILQRGLLRYQPSAQCPMAESCSFDLVWDRGSSYARYRTWSAPTVKSAESALSPAS